MPVVTPEACFQHDAYGKFAPVFPDLAALNDWLEERCKTTLDRDAPWHIALQHCRCLGGREACR